METFFDEVLTPGFAYKFVNFTKLYAYPKPFLKDKKVRTYITHGAPSLPVRTLYLNSVKLRLVLGVFSFVFGWKLSRWRKTRQFWSVPFVTEKKRKKYLTRVTKDIISDLKEGSEEPMRRVELRTFSLPRKRSTPELHRLKSF